MGGAGLVARRSARRSRPLSPGSPAGSRPWLAGSAAAIAALAAAAVAPRSAQAALSQDWSPFVLVAGLLLVGLVVEEDGLFAAAGRALASLARNDAALLGGTAVLVTSVTAVLNLDTAVAFVTPVVVHAARLRPGRSARVPVAACLLLANAGSLLLPGANLTNLIVVGGGHLAGARFFLRAAPPWAAAVAVTTAVLAVARWRESRPPHHEGTAAGSPHGEDLGDGRLDPGRQLGAERAPRLGLGLAASVAVGVLVLVLADAAVPVLVVGLGCTAVRVLQHRVTPRQAIGVLGPRVLIGLFALAVALGVLGRRWSGPARLLAHLDRLGTAALGAIAAITVNNLPAASLLSAGALHHPVSLLVGLDIGPNLFVTGALSWVLWLRSGRQAGGDLSVAYTTRLGVVAAPLALVAAVGMLALAG